MLPVVGIGTAIIFDFPESDTEKLELRKQVLRNPGARAAAR